jgi:hypothetical protein
MNILAPILMADHVDSASWVCIWLADLEVLHQRWGRQSQELQPENIGEVCEALRIVNPGRTKLEGMRRVLTARALSGNQWQYMVL